MKLKTWLKKKDMTAWKFATMHGLAVSSIYQYINEKRRMGAETAVMIEGLTKGEVDRRDALWPEDAKE